MQNLVFPSWSNVVGYMHNLFLNYLKSLCLICEMNEKIGKKNLELLDPITPSDS